jgi:hypothetical protein
MHKNYRRPSEIRLNPSAEIGNTKKIQAVWHRGKQAAGPVETFTP